MTPLPDRDVDITTRRMHGRRLAGKHQQMPAVHVHGQIDEDIDLVLPNHSRDRLVRQSNNIPPPPGRAAQALGDAAEVHRLAVRVPVNLEQGDAAHVGGAADEGKEAFAIQIADIAGIDPAIDHQVRGALLALSLAEGQGCRDGRRAHPDDPGLACGQRTVVGIDDLAPPDFNAWDTYYLAASLARVGEPERAVELLRGTVRMGRISPHWKLAFDVAAVPPLESESFARFLEEYETLEKRLRELY